MLHVPRGVVGGVVGGVGGSVGCSGVVGGGGRGLAGCVGTGLTAVRSGAGLTASWCGANRCPSWLGAVSRVVGGVIGGVGGGGGRGVGGGGGRGFAIASTKIWMPLCCSAGGCKVDFLSPNGYGKGLKLSQILGASGLGPRGPHHEQLIVTLRGCDVVRLRTGFRIGLRV